MDSEWIGLAAFERGGIERGGTTGGALTGPASSAGIFGVAVSKPGILASIDRLGNGTSCGLIAGMTFWRSEIGGVMSDIDKRSPVWARSVMALSA